MLTFFLVLAAISLLAVVILNLAWIYNRSDGVFLLAMGATCVTVLSILGALFAVTYGNDQVRQDCVVTEKDRTSHDGKSDARVYTENCGVMTVSDMKWLGNFHSSDTFASIKVGESYDLHTKGYRLPFFSRFPNIIDVNPENTN